MEFKANGETTLNSYFEDYMNYNSFYSDGQPRSAYLKSKTNLKPVSTIRKTVPQVLAVLMINTTSFEIGLSIGFVREMFIHTIEEKPKDSHSQLTFMSTIMLITGVIGYLVSGPIVENIGRQRTLLFVSLSRSAQWLFLTRATKDSMQMLYLGLFGLTGGLMHGPIMMYVAEISKPHLRGALLTVCPLAISAGILCESVSTCFELVDRRTLELACSGYSLLSFFILLYAPESPHWLARTGQIERTEQALCWLRGWVEPDSVRSEVRHLCKILAKRGYPAGVRPPTIESEELTKATLSQTCSVYSGKSFWTPFLLSFVAITIKAFGGSCMTQMLVPIVSNRLKFPLHPDTLTTISGSLDVMANIISMCIIYVFGKRKLILTSTSILIIAQIVLSITIFVENKRGLGESFGYIVTALMLSITFISQCGVVLIPYLLTSEIFPMETKGIGIGLVNATGLITLWTAIKIFIFFVNHMGDASTYLCFALVNFLGCTILYFILPDTDGKSLIEIKKLFADERRQQSRT